ncbi:MAG: hypothetical protein OXG35_19390 [Acidobacteria bacterium]|nr:hypothetical protein [Acidobacteriota bacterium]
MRYSHLDQQVQDTQEERDKALIELNAALLHAKHAHGGNQRLLDAADEVLRTHRTPE